MSISTKPTLVLLTTSLGWGGTEGYVRDLVRGYVRRGIDPIVLVDEPPLDTMSVLVNAGVRVEVLSETEKGRKTDYATRLRSILQSVNADIAHMSIWKRRVVIIETLHELRIPIIETIHATFPFKGRFWLLRHRLFLTRTPIEDWKLARTLRKVQPLIIHVSDLSLSNFRRLHPYVLRTKRIYCGAYLPAKVPDSIVGKTVTVLWVGTMIERKRPILAARIWKDIISEFPWARLIMVGDGPQIESVRKLASDLPSTNILILGSVPDLFPFLAESQIMLHTSTAEGIPKNIRYAMNFGIPVVSTNVGAIGEILTDGENGFVADVNDVDKIKDGLRKLLKNADLRNSMAVKARQCGKEIFDMEVAIDNTIQSYMESFNVDLKPRPQPDDYRPSLD